MQEMLLSDMPRLILLTTIAVFFSISSLYAAGFPSGNLTEAGRTTILKHENQTILLIEKDRKTDQPPGIVLELSGFGTLLLESGTETEILEFSVGDIKESISIYEGTTGIFPEKIIISGSFDLFSAGVFQATDSSVPMPADIGHIIFSDFSLKRNPEWELYSWNLLPEVIIFDTADYSVQARLFKRLAFFVEKPGFTGTLVSDKNLENRHGWNAHDYKADDLAAFFSKAEAENFQLNSEELMLKDILLERGIITESTEGGTSPYQEGKGVVLSVSRETLPSWRYRFLTHECLHSIFFTNKTYREDIGNVIAALAPAEIEYWKRLLDYRRYDVTNEYLFVNEITSYSLQQPMDETDDYFKGFMSRRMVAARSYEKEFVDNFLRTRPSSFTQTASALGDVLRAYTGRGPGHLANLYPADLPSSFFNLFPPAK